MVREGEIVIFLHRLVHSILASLASSWPDTDLAMDAACPPRRALATLVSSGPKTPVYWCWMARCVDGDLLSCESYVK